MNIIEKYNQLLDKKRHSDYSLGFNHVFMPDFLFDYQKALVEWALKKGRCGIFADCGLGKTPLALVIAQNIVEKTNKNVLIVTPLSVTHEFLKQGEKFGVEIKRSKDGKSKGKITVTNYEKLHMFDPLEYAGNIFDESSIIKNPLNKTKYTVSRFTSKTPYRFLMIATAAPNDYPEFGNSSEVLGVGSEVYGAVELGRRGIGFELKESYFRQAKRVLQNMGQKEEGEANLFTGASSDFDSDFEGEYV